MRAVVVRLWTGEGPGGAGAVLRGVVEPVGAGEAQPFRHERELLELLRAEVERAAHGAPGRSAEGPHAE